MRHNASQYFDKNKFNNILHPLTNGHAREWPMASYRALIATLPQDQFHVILTGSQSESEQIENELDLHWPTALNLAGKLSLDYFLSLI